MYKISTSILFLLITMLAGIVSASTTAIPKPFFFTENKGQWDSRVLYKCSAKNGMTWFLERDGITLLVSREQGTGNGDQESEFGDQGKVVGELGIGNRERGNLRGRDIPYGEPKRVPVAEGRGGLPRPPDAAVHRTFLSDDPMENDLPEMLRRHPQRKYPMKSHALKFKFFKGDGSWVMGSSEENGSFPKTQHLTPNTVIAEAQSIEAQGELPWKNNYFLGNDSSKWAPNCRNYSSVVYREVWEGIDIEWYENDGKLEFDFIVHPGFDPNQIRMSCEGLDGELSLAGDGFWGMGSGKKIESVNPTPNTQSPTPTKYVRALLRDLRTTDGIFSSTPITQHPIPMTELLLPTSLGELRAALPSVYQISANGTRNEIDAQFELTDQNTFGIVLPNGHDHEKTLRIDPLVYSTYLGGSGTEYGRGIASDGSGGSIVIGSTNSTNYPVIAGSIDPFYNGNQDCFVTHLNNSGTQLLYSTYLGGSSIDNGRAIVPDNSGGVFLTGYTQSSNFPVTTLNYYTWNVDIFVCRLNSSGSQLIYSSCFGGISDEFATAIVCDENGSSYITGSTSSSDFPTTPGAYDRTYHGGGTFGEDCFVLRLDSAGTQLLYSTYLGGSQGGEGGNAVAMDSSGGIFVTGWTDSRDFPTTPGVVSRSLNGGANDTCYDGFVAHLNSTGSQLLYSTFLGGARDENSLGCVSDGVNELYITGWTSSANFPVSPSAFDTTYNGGSEFGDCFITKLNRNGSLLIFSTYLGGTGDDGASAIIRDSTTGVIIAGYSVSADIPITFGSYDNTYNGGTADGFIAKINNTGSQLCYSTYLGGNANEGISSLVFLSSDEVIVTGSTHSTNYPVTSGAFDTTINERGDVFVTRFRLVADSTSIDPAFTEIPQTYQLLQNYPNPFNSSTTIFYTIPKAGRVELKLFDMMGREVKTLVDGKLSVGSYRVTVDGSQLSSGTYFVRMQAGGFVKTRKMVLLR